MISRAEFDSLIDEFRAHVDTSIRAASADCRFLNDQLEMLASRRYLDRLYDDFVVFARHLGAKSRVLDFGAGSGIAGWLFSGMGHDADGIDIDCFADQTTSMAAEQRLLWTLLTAAHPTLHFQHYWNNIIPAEPAAFDAVVAYGVIEHIPEDQLQEVMTQIRRVTKPGGHLLVSYLPRRWAWLEIANKLYGRNYHQRRWGDQEIQSFLARFGFETVAFRRVIYAPQFPSWLANKYQRLFDALDRLADIWPFRLFARDILLVASRRLKTEG